MARELNARGAADRWRIDLDDENEMNHWRDALGVTREDLVAAVGKVGPIIDDVRAHLARQPKRDKASPP